MCQYVETDWFDYDSECDIEPLSFVSHVIKDKIINCKNCKIVNCKKSRKFIIVIYDFQLLSIFLKHNTGYRRRKEYKFCHVYYGKHQLAPYSHAPTRNKISDLTRYQHSIFIRQALFHEIFIVYFKMITLLLH